MADKGKVLLVDDEEIILDVSREVFRFSGTTLHLQEKAQRPLSCMHRKKRLDGLSISLLLTLLFLRGWVDGRQ